MIKPSFQNLSPYALLCALIGLLYGQFLWNPIFFDDLNFFTLNENGGQPIDLMRLSPTMLRSLPYVSLSWTKEVFGLSLPPYRIGNLLIHAAVAMALYGFLSFLLVRLNFNQGKNLISPKGMALIAAALFAMHPLSTYAVGYLVQRSILLAELFCILAMWVYAYGSINKKENIIWASALLYYLAVFSKEHAVTLIALFPVMTIYLHEDWRAKLIERRYFFVGLLFIASLVIAAQRGIIGSVYEVEGRNLLGEDYGRLTYPYSIITQAGLFFKYLGMFLLPDVTAMSIDMREPFVVNVGVIQVAAVLMYLTWGALATFLLFKRQIKGLVGLLLLMPWLMFMTEFTTVRIQEPFVLYRSYLWFPTLFALIPLMLYKVKKDLVIIISSATVVALFVLSMERLITLSNPILVWNDARILVEKNQTNKGADRIYYNLARHLLLSDMLADAEKYIDKAITVSPEFAQAHAVRGAIFLKRKEWGKAIEAYSLARNMDIKRNEQPSYIYLMGRAQAYEGAGQLQLAANDYLEACRIDLRICEELRKKSSKP